MKRRILALVLTAALVLSLVPTALAAPPAASTTDEKPLRLWYDEPAKLWMLEALPIGNGHMGGMVFGGTAEETIQFNEKTLWSGGPGASGLNKDGTKLPYNFGINDARRADAYEKVQAARAQLENGQWGGTGIVPYGNPDAMGTYQHFGEIKMYSRGWTITAATRAGSICARRRPASPSPAAA